MSPPALRRSVAAAGTSSVKAGLESALLSRRIDLGDLGEVELTASSSALRSLDFIQRGTRTRLSRTDPCLGAHAVLDAAEGFLRAYAAGHGGPGRPSLPRLPAMALPSCSAFTQDVLRLTSTIGFGTAVSYGALASALGKPGAARAVGQALGRNPIAIFIPCHRVLAAHGMGGFTCGLDIKRILLRIEGITGRGLTLSR